MSRNLHDISLPLSADTVHWPGDPRFERVQVASLEAGDPANVSQLTMSSHFGTHIDAPSHYLEGGEDISRLAFGATVGSCHVFEIPPHVARIEAEHIEHIGIVEAERVLFKTHNSRVELLHRAEFDTDNYVHLSPEAATFLASHHVRCVGIDSLSIGGPSDGDETHRNLLRAGIWIIEGLDLRKINPGEYELICLPLRIVGSDGAPARAILREFANGDAFKIRESIVEDAIEFSTQTG